MPGSHRTSDSSRSTERRWWTSPRGKLIAASTTVVALAGGTLGYFAVFPQQAPAFVRSAMESVGIAEDRPDAPDVEVPMRCPLTGEEVERVPDRPALAIKIENSPAARPQSALNDADIVVEEPVEGGLTRFIAIYQCETSDRVGPVRSGRLTDPDYLRQLGQAVFGYAGGVTAVKREVPEAGIVDVNYIEAADAYVRDETKASPHDLYTTTGALWRAGKASDEAPEPLFGYVETWGGKARRVSSAHLGFSSASDVFWTWSRRDGWLRAHGSEPHVLEDGSQVSASNVVIQVVGVTAGSIVDAAGNYSPDVELTGSGRAYVLRDGRVILGRWERDTLDDVTTFVTKDGTEIRLAPGRTWVELLPSTVAVELTK